MRSLKPLLIAAILGLFVLSLTGQSIKSKLYNPEADAKKQIADAVEKAKAENKHVMLQVGGNWCGWCIEFHKFVKEHPTVDSLMKANYIYVMINTSKERPNYDVLAKLEYPQRFGFPVFVVLDQEGKRLHTQDSSYFEEDSYYGEEKIISFLKNWTPLAIDPVTYRSKH